MASISHPVLQPVSSSDRVHYIDVLRGFALYGVLLANLIWFVCDIVLTPVAAGQLPTPAMDRIVKYLVVFFIDGKFITLFAFLFAVGFTIQMQRALQSGRNGLAIYARRVTVLLVIGAVHIVFIWFGDILFVYSLLGFGLLLVRKWRPGISMLVVACLLILLPRVTFISVQQVRPHDRPAQIAASHPEEAQQQQTLAAFRGSYASVIRRNVAIYWGDLFVGGLILVMLPQVFGRFLLGLYVGKRGYIYHVAEYTPLLRRAWPWLLLVACAGNGASVAQEWAQHTLRLPPTTTWMVALRPLMEAGVVCLSACYAVWIALLLQSQSWAPVVARLAPVGRMALTNYLAHSLCYLFFLTGAGLGMLGHFGATVCLALSILIFGAQVVFSRWWLRHYRFGPAEWLWRSLTYGQSQPMRLTAQTSAEPT